MIKVLLPSTAKSADAQLQRLVTNGPLEPFNPLVLDFISDVSRAVLTDRTLRRTAEMAAVAHWMRKAHLLELRDAFEKERGNRVWLSRGLVLHFAPANVDSIFVYSWFISMLLGNQNVIRLSDRRGQQVQSLLGVMDTLCAEPQFRPIAERSLLLEYPHNDAVTRRLSEVCQLRVLWGGDESVQRLRAVPLNPLASEVAFADRFSLAVLDACVVADADMTAMAKLASRFCNDAYWFDQMACSSPRLMVWVGPVDICLDAQERFWSAVSDEVKRRNIQYEPAVGVNKLVSSYVAAATAVSDRVHAGVTGAVSRIHLADRREQDFRQVHCEAGLFLELELEHIQHLAGLLTQRDQTLSYFGFSSDQLRQFARSLPTRAVDRIVPIGSALEFGTVWDGTDLFRVFSREVDVH
jgi:hypothetical protein